MPLIPTRRPSLISAGVLRDQAGALSLLGARKRLARASTTADDVPFFKRVWMMLVKAAKASAPGQVLEHWDTLRAITAGRSIRSTRLLVGSTSGCSRKRNRSPRWW